MTTVRLNAVLAPIASMCDHGPYFQQDEDTGRITEKYADSAFVEAVDEHSPASTSEIAETVGCSRDNAYRRLKRLENAEDIRSKYVGNSLIWLKVDTG